MLQAVRGVGAVSRRRGHLARAHLIWRCCWRWMRAGRQRSATGRMPAACRGRSPLSPCLSRRGERFLCHSEPFRSGRGVCCPGSETGGQRAKQARCWRGQLGESVPSSTVQSACAVPSALHCALHWAYSCLRARKASASMDRVAALGWTQPARASRSIAGMGDRMSGTAPSETYYVATPMRSGQHEGETVTFSMRAALALCVVAGLSHQLRPRRCAAPAS